MLRIWFSVAVVVVVADEIASEWSWADIMGHAKPAYTRAHTQAIPKNQSTALRLYRFRGISTPN